MGRNYLSIENSREYCDFGQKRIDQAQICIGDIEKAGFDIRPPKVTMQEMINCRMFEIGEKMFFKGTDKYVVLDSPNTVKQYGSILDMHKAAAIANGGKAERLNGWEYWYVQRNNKFVLINDIRQKYIKEFHII
jgi:site-specific DNA-methyltransferase (adenine-specific)